MTETITENYIPKARADFVKFGVYDEISAIMNSGIHFPILVTGPTGAGKTMMIQQIHADLKKPMLRVNITIESDEDSLMGGFRLAEGATYFSKGPVIQAMEMGATLLLDEIDLGMPTKLMCLQSVLEGEGYLIKRTGEWITPKPGFNVIATANTKGLGDETGIYIGTQILNAAMMDRFPIVCEAPYPDRETELNIVNKNCDMLGIDDKLLPDNYREFLVDWAGQTRDTDENTLGLEHCISTRRLVDIIAAYKIFNNLDNAVRLCLNKYDEAHSKAFHELYRTMKPTDERDSATLGGDYDEDEIELF